MQHKRKIKYMVLSWALLAFMGLSGCGLKGPLYVPDKNHPKQNAPDPNKPSWF